MRYGKNVGDSHGRDSVESSVPSSALGAAPNANGWSECSSISTRKSSEAREEEKRKRHTSIDHVQPIEQFFADDAVSRAVGGQVQDLRQRQDRVHGRVMLQPSLLLFVRQARVRLSQGVDQGPTCLIAGTRQDGSRDGGGTDLDERQLLQHGLAVQRADPRVVLHLLRRGRGRDRPQLDG